MMIRSMFLVSCLAGATLLAGCASEDPNAANDAMIAAANTLDSTFMDAFNRGDADAVVGLYASDAVSFFPDALIARGTAEIQAGTTMAFGAMPGAQLDITESHQMPLGNAVAGWGLFKLTIPTPDGGEAVLFGRYTDLKAERDGKWVYLLDHASVPLPGGN